MNKTIKDSLIFVGQSLAFIVMSIVLVVFFVLFFGIAMAILQ